MIKLKMKEEKIETKFWGSNKEKTQCVDEAIILNWIIHEPNRCDSDEFRIAKSFPFELYSFVKFSVREMVKLGKICRSFDKKIVDHAALAILIRKQGEKEQKCQEFRRVTEWNE